MSDDKNLGYCEGEICRRNGCEGVIADRTPENCSCHISPPCSACVSDRSHCPECDWESANDPTPIVDPINQDGRDYWSAWQREQDRIRNAPLDNTKVSWRHSSHSTCSMIKEGVYPESGDEAKDREMVRTEVSGTFGGRFEYFGGGKFKFIAYTD